MPQEKVFVIAADHLVNGQRRHQRHRLPHATNKTRVSRRNLRLPWPGNALKPNQTLPGKRETEGRRGRVEVISEPSANETLTALACPAWWLFSFRFGAATREATKEAVKNYALPYASSSPLPPPTKLSTHVKWKIHLTAAVRRRRTSSIKACKWA